MTALTRCSVNSTLVPLSPGGSCTAPRTNCENEQRYTPSAGVESRLASAHNRHANFRALSGSSSNECASTPDNGKRASLSNNDSLHASRLSTTTHKTRQTHVLEQDVQNAHNHFRQFDLQ